MFDLYGKYFFNVRFIFTIFRIFHLRFLQIWHDWIALRILRCELYFFFDDELSKWRFSKINFPEQFRRRTLPLERERVSLWQGRVLKTFFQANFFEIFFLNLKVSIYLTTINIDGHQLRLYHSGQKFFLKRCFFLKKMENTNSKNFRLKKWE